MGHEKNTKLMEALNNCVAECNHCLTACLDEKDVKMMVKCIKLDMDCADICNLMAKLIARGSEHAKHLIKECIEICNACAEECDKHAHMEHCKNCAEACRKCAEECAKYK